MLGYGLDGPNSIPGEATETFVHSHVSKRFLESIKLAENKYRSFSGVNTAVRKASCPIFYKWRGNEYVDPCIHNPKGLHGL